MSYFNTNDNENEMISLVRTELMNEVGIEFAKYFLGKPYAFEVVDSNGEVNEVSQDRLNEIAIANKLTTDILFPIIYNLITNSKSAIIIDGINIPILQVGFPSLVSIVNHQLVSMNVTYAPVEINGADVTRYDEVKEGSLTREVIGEVFDDKLDDFRAMTWQEYLELSGSKNLLKSIEFNNKLLVSGVYFENITDANFNGSIYPKSEFTFVEHWIKMLGVQLKSIIDELDNNKTGIIFLRKGVNIQTANKLAQTQWDTFRSNNGAMSLDPQLLYSKGIQGRLPWEMIQANPKFNDFITLFDWTKNKIFEGIKQTFNKEGTYNAQTTEIKASVGDTSYLDMKGQFIIPSIKEMIKKVIIYDTDIVKFNHGDVADVNMVFNKSKLIEADEKTESIVIDEPEPTTEEVDNGNETTSESSTNTIEPAE